MTSYDHDKANNMYEHDSALCVSMTLSDTTLELCVSITTKVREHGIVWTIVKDHTNRGA